MLVVRLVRPDAANTRRQHEASPAVDQSSHVTVGEGSGVAHAPGASRRRTDRHVTQPSSFTYSLMSTSTVS